MTPSHPCYTRLDLVSAISEFYTFLTRFYIPASALKFPPPDGWPNITPSTTSGFGKSPLVIDLIKHLPYIDEADAHESVTNIHYKCDVVDYSVWTAQDFEDNREPCGEIGVQERWEERQEEKRREEMEGIEEEHDEEPEVEDNSNETSNGPNVDSANQDDEDATDSGVDCESDSDEWDDEDPDDFDMANMIVLAEGYESGGRNIVLDVMKGTIHEDMISCNLLSPVDALSFFQDLRGQYEKLEMVPVPGQRMYDQFNIGDSEAKEYQRIYRHYGWPGDAYQKVEALKAVEEYRQEREKEEEQQR